MNVREAKIGLDKAISFVEEGIRQILRDELDENHGVSVSPGATTIASLCLLVLGKGYENSQRRGVYWLIQAKQTHGWGKVPEGTPDAEVTRIAQLIVQANQGGLLNKLALLEQAKQLAELVLTLGQDVVPGLEGPTIEEIRLPYILQEKALNKLPAYGRSVVIAASLLAAIPDQQGIKEAIEFIQKSQMPDGSWAGDIVATSLCIMALLRFIGHDPIVHRGGRWLVKKQYASGGWPAFDQLKNWVVGWGISILGSAAFPVEDLNKAHEWLIKAGNHDGSYGTTPPHTHPDLDDTAIALMALPKGSEDANRTIQILRELQNEDGSWGTFPSFKGQPPNIKSCFPVYISSLDVTVHVVEALRRQSLSLNDPCIIKAMSWILRQQKKDGHFQSVWFEGTIYGTAQVVDLLDNAKFGWNMLKTQRQVYHGRQKAIDYLLRHCNSSGGWGESVSETALAISALKKEAMRFDRIVFEKAIQSILIRQKEAGSFESSYQGIYAKGWNYEEPISTALTVIRALQWYLFHSRQ